MWADRSFSRRYANASEFEQQILVSMFKGARPSEESTWLEGPAYWALPRRRNSC
jgi:hypothetical protein